MTRIKRKFIIRCGNCLKVKKWGEWVRLTACEELVVENISHQTLWDTCPECEVKNAKTLAMRAAGWMPEGSDNSARDSTED